VKKNLVNFFYTRLRHAFLTEQFSTNRLLLHTSEWYHKHASTLFSADDVRTLGRPTSLSRNTLFRFYYRLTKHSKSRAICSWQLVLFVVTLRWRRVARPSHWECDQVTSYTASTVSQPTSWHSATRSVSSTATTSNCRCNYPRTSVVRLSHSAAASPPSLTLLRCRLNWSSLLTIFLSFSCRNCSTAAA